MIRWKDADGAIQHGSLFAVFAGLSRDEVMSFPALRPHQREPWHAFCVQIAAMALIAAGRDTLPETEAAWHELLIGLTPEWPDGEAWELVVDDWRKPALLQPPLVRDADRSDYRSRLSTPDALDMLVTAKNHDVKQERMVAARDEDWLFALMTLQTTEGFLGAGNYGISRMNGGFASRMSLGIRPAGNMSAAFRRDVLRLTELAAERSDWRKGLPLLWLKPWDGTESLAYGSLDTLYVEICRRVRLEREANDDILAWTAGSKTARVAASALNGKTDDPWAPIKADATASVTPGGSGFGYRQITRLLDKSQTTLAPLAEFGPHDDAQGLAIVASALVRGQGKTEGLHRRTVPISRRIRPSLIAPERVLDATGAVAKRRTDAAGDARGRLRRALLALVQGGPDQVRLDDDAGKNKIAPWERRFDLAVDRIFFDDAFWAEVAGEDASHEPAWRERLCDMARTIFADAAEAAPRTEVRRIRAHARAKNRLEAELHHFMEKARDG